jgi:hypothetical protein
LTGIPFINDGPVRVLAFELPAVAVTAILLGLVVNFQNSYIKIYETENTKPSIRIQ